MTAISATFPLVKRSAPLWLLVLVTFSGTLAMHMFVPALPDAAQRLGVDAATIRMTISVYIFGLAVGQLVYGPLSDVFGRRPTLLVGLALYTAGGLAATLAPSAGVLIAARLVQAAGGCAGLLLGRAIVRDTAGSNDAVRRLALMSLMTMVGPGLAPLVGSLLAAAWGWRAIFVVLTALGRAQLRRVLAPAARDGHAERAHQRAKRGARLPRAAGLAALRGLRTRRGLRDDVVLRLHRRRAVHLLQRAAPAAARGGDLSRAADRGRVDRQHPGEPPDRTLLHRAAAGGGQRREPRGGRGGAGRVPPAAARHRHDRGADDRLLRRRGAVQPGRVDAVDQCRSALHRLRGGPVRLHADGGGRGVHDAGPASDATWRCRPARCSWARPCWRSWRSASRCGRRRLRRASGHPARGLASGHAAV